MTDKPKISTLVANQLPEFVREDYPTFVAFMQAYYDFLETTQVDIKDVKNIDVTLDSFLDLIKKEVAHNLPNTLNIDKRLLIEKSKDLYLSKGSQQSFELLFRLLYDKNVSVIYPSRQLLKASDGRWVQDYSLFVRVKTGNPEDIVGQTVNVITSIGNVKIYVDRVAKVTNTFIDDDSDLYEYIIDRRFYGTLSIGDIISYNGYSAVVVPTITKIKIVKGGAGFKAGQLYNIRTTQGTGCVLKINSIGVNGSIKTSEIIKFGTGYENNVTFSLAPAQTREITSTGLPAYSNNLGNITIRDTNDISFTDGGYVNIADYAVDAWDGTYSGDIVSEFFTPQYVFLEEGEDFAILDVIVGALAKYPGYFSTNDGFLNDSVRIQDSYYYQAYSYVLRIDEQLENYKNAVKTILHPSGMAMFAEYNILNNIDVGLALTSAIKILSTTVLDNVTLSDSSSRSVAKRRLNNQPVIDSISNKSFSKSLTESYTLNDTARIGITKRFFDSVTIDDPIFFIGRENSKDFGSSTSTIDSTQYGFSKQLQDTFTQQDNTSIALTKSAILDSQPFLHDSISISKGMDRTMVDMFYVTDTPSKGISKTFNEIVTITDLAGFEKEVDFFHGSTIEDISSFTFHKTITEEIFNPNLNQFIDMDLENTIAGGFIPLDNPENDFGPILDLNNEPRSSLLVVDFNQFSLNKYITDTYFTQDLGGFILMNPYVDAGYTAQRYVGEPTEF
jgi:hypothetical protein